MMTSLKHSHEVKKYNQITLRAESYRSRSVEGVLVERELWGWGNRRMQQETIEVGDCKGSWSKESCGLGGTEGSSRRLDK